MNTQEPIGELDAMGLLFAQIPEVQELLAYRRTLPDWLQPEDLRERVLAEARELGLAMGGDRFLDMELQPELLDADLWGVAAQLVAEASTRWPGLTLRQVIRRIAKHVPWDDFVFDYVESSVRTGKPAAYNAVMHGDAVAVKVPAGDGETIPAVIVIVTPHSRAEDLFARARDVAAEAFADYTVHDPGTLAEYAAIMAWRGQGLKYPQIAWKFLAERHPEIEVMTDDDRKLCYGREHKRELARLRQLRRRI